MMVLSVVSPGNFYFDLRFEDIPPQYILGGRCFMCRRTGPVDRLLMEQRYGPVLGLVRHLDDKLRCLGCGNRVANRFLVYGIKIRKLSELPAGLEIDAAGTSGERTSLI